MIKIAYPQLFIPELEVNSNNSYKIPNQKQELKQSIISVRLLLSSKI